jgi:hypothetical protein
MSNENVAAPDPTVFVAVFNQNWDNARHIKTERISFMNAICLVSLCANEQLSKGFAPPRLRDAKATISADSEIALSGPVPVAQFLLSQRQRAVIAGRACLKVEFVRQGQYAAQQFLEPKR